MDVEQVIEETKFLSIKEKAFIAHSLISSLDRAKDQGVDQAWAELSKKRYDDLITGKTKPISWEDIKKSVIT